MEKYMKKPHINTLLNVDNIFGTYENRVAPFILTILLGSIPLFIWLFFLQGTPIKLWMAIILTLLLTGRFALIFIGKESEKLKSYSARRNDAYLESKDLINVTDIIDGLIMYTSGRVSYIIYGYLKGYLDDDVLSIDLERFMDELDAFDWDMNLYNITDELLCTGNLPNLRRYKDKETILQRIAFYKYQDDWVAKNTEMYELVFIVKARKYNWKQLRSKLIDLIDSDVAKCFNEIYIADTQDVIDIMSRDIETHVDLNEMLLNKMSNEEISGARVLFYDDEDLVKAKEDKAQGVDLRDRRSSINAGR
jgi:hypothetical protein